MDGSDKRMKWQIEFTISAAMLARREAATV